MAKKGKLTFDVERCKGCGLCISFCPKKILDFDDKSINQKGYHPVQCVKPEECIACISCATMCPDQVITVEEI